MALKSTFPSTRHPPPPIPKHTTSPMPRHLSREVLRTVLSISPTSVHERYPMRMKDHKERLSSATPTNRSIPTTSPPSPPTPLTGVNGPSWEAAVRERWLWEVIWKIPTISSRSWIHTSPHRKWPVQDRHPTDWSIQKSPRPLAHIPSPESYGSLPAHKSRVPICWRRVEITSDCGVYLKVDNPISQVTSTKVLLRI